MAEPRSRLLMYIETTVPSYLSARPSADPILSQRQELTRRWWAEAITRCDLVVSQIVLEEAGGGDSGAAQGRLHALSGIAVLPFSSNAVTLAAEYSVLLQLPSTALNDALHVAYSVVFGVDYLVTWNLKHLASSFTMRQITAFNIGRGLHVPLIVTPEYLLELEEPEN